MDLDQAIMDLMDELETADDATVARIAGKLDRLRLHTAGSDREMVIQAIMRCRELQTPAGNLHRALADAVREYRGGADAE